MGAACRREYISLTCEGQYTFIHSVSFIQKYSVNLASLYLCPQLYIRFPNVEHGVHSVSFHLCLCHLLFFLSLYAGLENLSPMRRRRLGATSGWSIVQVLGGDMLTCEGGSAMAEVFEVLELYGCDHGVNIL